MDSLTTINPTISYLEKYERGPEVRVSSLLLMVNLAILTLEPSQTSVYKLEKCHLPITVPWHDVGQHHTWKASLHFLRTENQLVLEISP